MKTIFTFRSATLLLSLFLLPLLISSQNWQYTGTPYFNQTSTFYTSIDIPDMEIGSSGDVFVGYTDGVSDPKTLKVAKYSGGSWLQMPSPGTLSAVSRLDVEVQGSNCYLAYCQTKNSKTYVFVTKYNGSNAWTRVGDSLLMGTAGTTGFDFLLDNNGVPTVLGPVTSTVANPNKTVMQYTGGAWAPTYTIPNSAGTSFQENAAAFDSQNKLYCITTGNFFSPTFKYYTLVHKITGATDVIVGDTLFNSATGNNRIKINASNVPYICMNGTLVQRVLAYRLNSNNWTLMGDTTVKTGNMYSMDLTTDNKIVFYSLALSPFKKRIYSFDNTSITMMDTLNTTAALGAVGDIVIPVGGNDVYAVAQEIKTGAVPDISVMKHSLGGTTPTGIRNISLSDEVFTLFPNPSTGAFEIINNKNTAITIEINDAQGKIVTPIQNCRQFDLSGYPRGIYFVRISDGMSFKNVRLIIQ